jgi:phosphoglycolate phosphatase
MTESSPRSFIWPDWIEERGCQLTADASGMFLVFDLDGTLIDGYAGIADALAYAMGRLGVPALAPERVRGMVGRGLEGLLEEAVGADLAPEGVRLFRERYAAVAVEKTVLLPDVPHVLDLLAAAGCRMAVASNKPAAFTRLILGSRGVLSHFVAVTGPDDSIPPKPDPAMLRGLMERVGASSADTIVVGDMEIDAEMARAAGCRVVLIAGGSRSAEELAQVPADAHLSRIAELPEWLGRIS